ncbi:uncharacterized protein TNCV_2830781 [Trichonephila clavipes]|nr:uncharacterized protein TNCV_2830781 [Trichonephila clavipes]
MSSSLVSLKTRHVDGPMRVKSVQDKSSSSVVEWKLGERVVSSGVGLFTCSRFKIHKFTCRNCGGGDRGRVAIYRPFGEVSLSLNRTVTCMVLKANDRRRQAYLLHMPR